MKSDILQQEILLLTGTTFSQRQLQENDTKDDNNNLSESEKTGRSLLVRFAR
jgi:hypothetical protein